MMVYSFHRQAFETGILKRLEMIWNIDRKSSIKIGITEPESLGINNVMFPFSCLAATIVISVVMSVIEKLVNKVKVMKANSVPSRVVLVKQAWERRENPRKQKIDGH